MAWWTRKAAGDERKPLNSLIDGARDYCAGATTDEDRRAREAFWLEFSRAVLGPLGGRAAITPEPVASAPQPEPAEAAPARDDVPSPRVESYMAAALPQNGPVPVEAISSLRERERERMRQQVAAAQAAARQTM